MKGILLSTAFILFASVTAAQDGQFNRAATEQDANRFPFNPMWQCQKDRDCSPQQEIPDATVCDNSSTPKRCTTSPTNIDRPAGFKHLICGANVFEPSNLHGHVNFERAAISGDVTWLDHSFDWDYNFVVTPINRRLLTKYNDQTIGLEFDSRETLGRFKNVPGWWGSFQALSDDTANQKKIQNMIDSTSGNAVALGLLGVDCEHHCHSELHPIYGLAIRVRSTDPAVVRWAVMMRNSGDEGFCSHQIHPINTSANDVALLIPAETPSATVTTENFIGSPATIQTVAGKGVLLTVPSGNSKKTLVFGEIVIRYPKALQHRVVKPAAVDLREAKPPSEEKLASLMTSLTIEQRSRLRDHSLFFKPAIPEIFKPAVGAPLTAAKYSSNVLLRPLLKLDRELPTDEEKERNDKLYWQQICAAHGWQLPDPNLTKACAEVR